jgi:organic radical activating enzyme
LVITGGEPTLQANVLALITKALCHFSAIQVETNGTQPKFFEQAEHMGLIGDDRLEFIVSPKANERLKKYPQVPEKVQWWAHAYKFVISADPESAHHTIPEWALRSHKIVMVSPMTVYKKPYEGEVSSIWDADLVDQEQTAANYRYAAAYALKNNLRLSIQMHTITAIA